MMLFPEVRNSLAREIESALPRRFAIFQLAHLSLTRIVKPKVIANPKIVLALSYLVYCVQLFEFYTTAPFTPYIASEDPQI